jgi:hypothetical protein
MVQDVLNSVDMTLRMVGFQDYWTKQMNVLARRSNPGIKARRKATRKKFVVPTGGRVGSKKQS